MKEGMQRKALPATAISFFDVEIFLDIILQILTVFETIARVFGIELNLT
jgi:hypothetical protein